MLSAVLFDLDNTLVDRDRAFRECVDGCFCEPAAREELYQLDQRGHGDRGVLLAAWERHARLPMTQAMLGRMIAARIRPDDSLLNTLQGLSSIQKLGIVTNGGGATQRQKIRAARLDTVIRRVWVSDEVGAAKPDPAIFRLALKCLGVAPEHCLYIGDHAPHDRVGPAAAGMRGCLVDRVLDSKSLNTLLERARLR